MRCVDTIAMYLFYTFIIDFTLEMLDLIHRIYEADESFRSLDFMVHTKLYIPHIVIQICLGTLVPLVLLGITQVIKLPENTRRRMYGIAGSLTMIGIFAMRWNVVIGGTIVLEEFPGVHDLQDGAGYARGVATGNCADAASVRDSVGAGKGAAAVAGRARGGRRGGGLEEDCRRSGVRWSPTFATDQRRRPVAGDRGKANGWGTEHLLLVGKALESVATRGK